MSGSSMAAVAEWLEAAGFSADSISFFPAHELEVGPNVSDGVAARWLKTAAYIDEPTWVEEGLASALQVLLREPVRSLGEFRGAIADSPFSRSKLMFRSSSGRLIIAKWAGFAGLENRSTLEDSLLRQTKVAAAGFAPAPLGSALGYVFLPFVEGEPLLPEDRSGYYWMDRIHRRDLSTAIPFEYCVAQMAAPLEEVARYIRECPGENLAKEEVNDGLDRLQTLIEVNIGELFGSATAQSLVALRPQAIGGLASGDGDLSPVNWIADSVGHFVKAGCWNRAISHTYPGVQPVEWDVASAIVEWNLPPEAASRFASLSGLTDLQRLPFYIAGYCAFKRGLPAQSQ